MLEAINGVLSHQAGGLPVSIWAAGAIGLAGLAGFVLAALAEMRRGRL